MEKICSISFRRHKGFLLTEVLLALVIVSIAVMLLGRNVYTIFVGWQRMGVDAELLDAGRYMLTKLERHLALEATSIKITANSIIDCETEYPDKSTTIFLNTVKLGLYFTTDTEAGVGTNPLFIRDCMVSNWHAERINDKEILVSFTLNKRGRTKDFVRLFYCVNGTVKDGAK